MENYLINLALGFSVCILIVQSHQELYKDGVNYMEQQVDGNLVKNGDVTNAHSEVLSVEKPSKIHSTETPLKTDGREPSATYQPEGTHGPSEGNGETKSDKINVLWMDDDEDAFMSSEDYGYGTNCGPKESNVTFRWTPRVIDPQGSVKIEFKMVALGLLIVQSYQEINNDGVNYMDQKEDRNFVQNGNLTKAYTKALSDEKSLKIHSTATPMKSHSDLTKSKTEQKEPPATYQPRGMHLPGGGNREAKGHDIDYLRTDEDVFMSNEDYGNGTNCGPPQSKLQFHWTPRVIDPQGSVKIMFKMVAPVSFSYGKVTCDLAVLGQDSSIISVSTDLKCKEDIKIKELKCPVKKGLPIKVSYEETNLTRLPTGSFNVTVQMLNEDAAIFLCVQFPVESKPRN